MSNKRRKYTEDFRKNAVELFRSSGKPCTHIARDLGISESLLRKWNNLYDKDNAFPGNGNARDQEIYKLKKQIKILTEERDILKKSNGHFLKGRQMKYKFIEKYSNSFSIAKMAEILNVSRSGYYSWKIRPESKRSKENKKIVNDDKSQKDNE